MATLEPQQKSPCAASRPARGTGGASAAGVYRVRGRTHGRDGLGSSARLLYRRRGPHPTLADERRLARRGEGAPGVGGACERVEVDVDGGRGGRDVLDGVA